MIKNFIHLSSAITNIKYPLLLDRLRFEPSARVILIEYANHYTILRCRNKRNGKHSAVETSLLAQRYPWIYHGCQFLSSWISKLDVLWMFTGYTKLCPSLMDVKLGYPWTSKNGRLSVGQKLKFNFIGDRTRDP